MFKEQPKRVVRLHHNRISEYREKNGGLAYLSDWQVHSAHITAGDIKFLCDPLHPGPIYIPMPTGSGKTTGAIWAIENVLEEYPVHRICFLTPYQDSVEKVARELQGRLGSDVVGSYHSDAFVDKHKELKKQVVVLTHAFLTQSQNRGWLDDRDLFIVDEALFATGQATLQLQNILNARTWATSHNVMSQEFEALAELVIGMDQTLRAADTRYLAAPSLDDWSWAKAIAFDLNLSEHAQTIADMNELSAVQIFCEALIEGLVFLSKGKIDSERYAPKFSCAVLGIPNIERTAVLSATGGLVYDIAGPFKQSDGSKDHWTPPSYRNLKLVHLAGPKISGRYANWTTNAIKDQVVRYVDWLLSAIPEQEVYLTVPKQVLERCLLTYLGLSSANDIQYPIKTTKHGKTLWIANHARAIGSNEFKDCEAVIYLWDYHKPQDISVQRFHTLADEPITDTALAKVSSGRLTGDYERIKEAMYIDNMMQQIGRGRVRQFDDEAIAAPMAAYILTESATRFERLATQYPESQTTAMPYEEIEPVELTSRVEQIIRYLRTHGGQQDVSAKDVEAALGFRVSQYGEKFNENWFVIGLNYTFVRGDKGRSNSSYFRYTGKREG